MTSTDTLLADLAQLSDIDLSKRRLEAKSARSIELTQEATGVRTRIPASVLLHYDTRISRGKRGAARMRNNTCGGCNLSLPSGQLADLRQENPELIFCCNCSIYVLPALPQEADATAVVAKPATKKVAVKKPRKAKVAKAIAASEAEAAEEVAAAAEAEAEEEVEAEALASEEAAAEAEIPQEAEEAEAESEATPQIEIKAETETSPQE